MPETKTMRCPNFGAQMEGENFRVITGIYFGGVKRTPSGHYVCEECDSEWTWFARKANLIRLDTGNAEQLPSAVVRADRRFREIP